MKIEVTTAEQYLKALPADRRAAISEMRALVNQHLPKGFREGIDFGMIAWFVPLEVYPDTYNGRPLMYAALASQKQYMAIYLTTVYGDPGTQRAFREAFAKAGKKLDMGKSCVRFHRLEDLHLPAIATAIAVCGMQDFIARAKAAHAPEAREARRAARAGTASRTTAVKPAARKAAAKSASPVKRATASRRTARPAGARAAAR